MWTNPRETADLFSFIEKILNEKVHFCAVKDNATDCSKLMVFYTDGLLFKID